jgi:hypothetical protein
MIIERVRHRQRRLGGALESLQAVARRAGLSRSQAILLAAVLVPVILAFIAVNIWSWNSLGYVPLDRHGHIALVLGVVVTFGLGVGLMGLMFYSSRHGYDDGDGRP